MSFHDELVEEGSRCGGGMFGGINAGLFGPIEAMLGGGELCDSLLKKMVKVEVIDRSHGKSIATPLVFSSISCFSVNCLSAFIYQYQKYRFPQPFRLYNFSIVKEK